MGDKIYEGEFWGCATLYHYAEHSTSFSMKCWFTTDRLSSKACDEVETTDAHYTVPPSLCSGQRFSLSVCSVESPLLLREAEPGAFSASTSL
mmetsp:Transcript_12276/g.17629  ORF Transcript_12276/g.17629 Transcript_12276/m.17629 type:complete len:92 (-) Transcript_12276:3091-3366(-)